MTIEIFFLNQYIHPQIGITPHAPTPQSPKKKKVRIWEIRHGTNLTKICNIMHKRKEVSSIFFKNEAYFGTKVANSSCLRATALITSRVKIRLSAAQLQPVCPNAISN